MAAANYPYTVFMWLCFLLMHVTSLVHITADIMEDELMFSMEEEGSATRPPVQRKAPKQRASSLSDANASDDDDNEHFICPILHDSSKEICQYLKNLVNTHQLSNSLPKSNFMYKVSCFSGIMTPNVH